MAHVLAESPLPPIPYPVINERARDQPNENDVTLEYGYPPKFMNINENPPPEASSVQNRLCWYCQGDLLSVQANFCSLCGKAQPVHTNTPMGPTTISGEPEVTAQTHRSRNRSEGAARTRARKRSSKKRNLFNQLDLTRLIHVAGTNPPQTKHKTCIALVEWQFSAHDWWGKNHAVSSDAYDICDHYVLWELQHALNSIYIKWRSRNDSLTAQEADRVSARGRHIWIAVALLCLCLTLLIILISLMIFSNVYQATPNHYNPLIWIRSVGHDHCYVCQCGSDCLLFLLQSSIQANRTQTIITNGERGINLFVAPSS
eukprot:1046984_1